MEIVKNKRVDEIQPTETKRVRTSLNLPQTYVDGFTKVAKARNCTLTSVFDESMPLYLSEVNKTTEIDQMLKATNEFWFERPLNAVKKLLPPEKVKKLLPYQIAYLYFNLKDQADKERTFEALTLDDELKQINAINLILQKASIFNGQDLKGYNLHTVANELRATPTPLQTEYLSLKLGIEAFAKLQERRSDLFPIESAFSDGEKETPKNSKSPTKQSQETTESIANAAELTPLFIEQS